MRSLVVWLTAGLLVVGCIAPTPSPSIQPTPSPIPVPASPLPTPTPPAAPTPPAIPAPTIAAFTDPYPAPELGAPNWTVVASWDGSTDPDHTFVVSRGQAKRGALLDVAYACDRAAQITIRATDSGSGDPLFSFSAPCQPGTIGRGSFGPTDKKVTVSNDASTDPLSARFWVKVAVPTDHFAPTD